jgi:archaemetzincin
LISLARLGNLTAERTAGPQALRRTLKLAVCAVGQAVGIADFAAYPCGMNPVQGRADLDDKPLLFCPECVQKVWWLGDVEPLDRYKQLVEFANRHHLEQEHRHWQRTLEAIRTTKALP